MRETGGIETVEFTILKMCYEFPCTDGKGNLSKIHVMLKQMLTLAYHIHA